MSARRWSSWGGGGSSSSACDDGADALGRLVDEEDARRFERLELVETLPERFEARACLVEPPEEDPDDHSSGSSVGS